MKLSPINPTAAEALESELSQTLFQNADQFIQAYNSGMVNKRNASISEIAQKVSQTYRNIELSNSELTAISTDAISLNEISEAYTRWAVIVAVKNAIRDFTARSPETEVTGFVLSDESKKGMLFAVTSVEELTESDEYDEMGDAQSEVTTRSKLVPLEKVAKSAAAAGAALGNLSEEVALDGAEELAIGVKDDILDVDTSFLESVAEELSQH